MLICGPFWPAVAESSGVEVARVRVVPHLLACKEAERRGLRLTYKQVGDLVSASAKYLPYSVDAFAPLCPAMTDLLALHITCKARLRVNSRRHRRGCR